MTRNHFISAAIFGVLLLGGCSQPKPGRGGSYGTGENVEGSRPDQGTADQDSRFTPLPNSRTHSAPYYRWEKTPSEGAPERPSETAPQESDTDQFHPELLMPKRNRTIQI